MAVNPVVAKHLREARAELVAQRAELDAQRAEVDTAIASIESMLSGYAAPAAKRRSAARRGSSTTSMRHVVLAWINDLERETTTAEIIDSLASENGWAPASIRSLLARLVKEGALVSPRRGVYRLPEPLDASGAAAGKAMAPEVPVTASEGGERLDDADGQDHDSDQAGWNGGHRDRTVVAGSI